MISKALRVLQHLALFAIVMYNHSREPHLHFAILRK